MRAGWRTGCWVAAWLAAGVTASFAGALPTVQYPQWLRGFSHDVLVLDAVTESSAPTAIRLASGVDITLTTQIGGLVLRRYAADGSVAASLELPIDGLVDAVIRGSPDGSGFYVLAGGLQTGAQLLSFDASLQRRGSVALAADELCNRSCLRLQVLADGSAIAMRGFHLMRVDSDGGLQWTVTDVEEAGYFDSGELALGHNGDLWVLAVASASGSDHQAWVMRYGLDGTRLSAQGTSCEACAGLLGGVDVQDDGGAYVVGQQFYSFLADYDASGMLRAWTSNDDIAFAYTAVAHDTSGALYLQARSWTSAEVRRVDPADGSIVWAAPADDFAVRAVGVVTLRDDGPAISATALDAAGTAQWSVPLTVGSAGATSRPAYVDGAIELLVQDLAPSADPCSTYPREVRIDADGAVQRFPLPCRAVAEPERFGLIDALPGGGVLVNFYDHLVVLSPLGDLRWQAESCQWCDGYSGDVLWLAAALSADGGAWAVQWMRPSLASPDGATVIQRFDADGNLGAETPSAAATADNSSLRVLATPGDAIVAIAPVEQAVAWQRVRGDGSVMGASRFAIPDMYFHIDDARRFADDSVELVVKGDVGCLDLCPPHYTTLLRIGGDGTLLWRYQFPEFDPAVALNPDGSVMAAVPTYTSTGQLTLRSISANGVAADIPLTGLSPYSIPLRLFGPEQGHWLLAIQGSGSISGSLSLVDASGGVTAMLPDSAYLEPLTAAMPGYIVSVYTDAETERYNLLDPLSLLTKTAYFGGNALPDSIGPTPWQILDDGSIYAALPTVRGGVLQETLARFSAPGATADDVLFRDGFD